MMIFFLFLLLGSCKHQKNSPATMPEQKSVTVQETEHVTIASDPSWRLSFDGIGPVRVGMTLAQLNETLDERFEMPTDKEEQGCFYVESAKHPGVSFMIEDGILSRIDVAQPGVSTDEGIQVGDLQESISQRYGTRVKVEPHHYIPENGFYLTVPSANNKHAIRFETEDKKITSLYAGTAASIQYVEGCL